VALAEIRERVRADGLLAPDSAVIVMLSGGRDSVCLLDLTVELRGAERVRALHVNYGLRAESDGDERHCRELCERLQVHVEVVRADGRHDASGNLHAWARELRYRAASELAARMDERAGRDSHGAGVIATGHTATDQVETILYRLAASPGRRALLGMRAREGRLVRPLLAISREQTADYCRERDLRWREDSSNDDERYARARVRHGLVSALDAVHPTAQANVLRTAELLREETELLDALVDAELAGAATITLERLAQLPPALRRLVVIRLAEHAAGTFVPRAGERVAEILALGAGGASAELHVGGLVAAVVERGELRMVAIQPRPQHDGQ
jgi:tRNA(Ile)-lysidine synthase